MAIVVATGIVAHGAGAATAAGCSGTRAFVAGKSLCLKRGAVCKPRLHARYLDHGFICRRHSGKLRTPRLARASVAQRRQGAPILIGANGLPRKGHALQALATVGVRLPGVRVRKGTVGRLTSGSGPLRWVLAHRKRLSAEQRRALGAVLARAARPRARVASRQDEVDAAVTQAIGDLQARFGAGLGAVTVEAYAREKGNGGTGFAYPFDAADKQVGPLAKCVVDVYPPAFSTPDTLRVTVTHEVTHCFQYAFASPLSSGLKVESWLMEGFAEWAGADIASDSNTRAINAHGLAEFWQPYLDAPTTSLFARGYDAVGFFAQLRGMGLDPFGRWDTAENHGSDQAAHGAFFSHPGEQNAFLHLQPVGLFRRPGLGVIWDIRAAGIPKSKLEPEEILVQAGAPEKVGAERWASAQYEIVTPLPLLTIAQTGDQELLGYLAAGKSHYVGGDMERTFCTLPKGCSCSGGVPLDYPALGKQARLGLAAKAERLALRISGQKLGEACKNVTGTDIIVSGAVEERLRTDGSCEFEDGTWFGVFPEDRANGSTYLTIQFAGYTGPGTYPIRGAMTAETPTSQQYDFASYQPPGGDTEAGFNSYHNPYPTAGHVTVDAGGRTGSVSLQLDNKGSGAAVSLSGRFACPEL